MTCDNPRPHNAHDWRPEHVDGVPTHGQTLWCDGVGIDDLGTAAYRTMLAPRRDPSGVTCGACGRPVDVDSRCGCSD